MTRGGTLAWGLGEGLTTPPREKGIFVTKYSQTKLRTLTDTLVGLKQRKRGMKFGTWNVRSLYR
jgi:hypothetical protein